MKALLLVLALLSSCYVSDARYMPEPDYGYCLGPVYRTTFCDEYFIWRANGYYVLRPEYRLRYHHGRGRIERRWP